MPAWTGGGACLVAHDATMDLTLEECNVYQETGHAVATLCFERFVGAGAVRRPVVGSTGGNRAGGQPAELRRAVERFDGVQRRRGGQRERHQLRRQLVDAGQRPGHQ